MHKQGLLWFNFVGVDDLHFLVIYIVVAERLHVLVELEDEGGGVGDSEAEQSLIIDASQDLH